MNKTLAALSLSSVLAACVSTGPIVQDPPQPQQPAAPTAGRASVAPAQAPVAKGPVIAWEGKDKTKDTVGVQQCRGALTGGGKLDALKKFTGAASVDGGCVAVQTYDPAAKQPTVLVVGQITGVNCNVGAATAAQTAAHTLPGFMNKLPSLPIPGAGIIGGAARRSADTAGAAQVSEAQKVCSADLATVNKDIYAKLRALSADYSAAHSGVVPKAVCFSNLGKKDEAAILPAVCVPTPTPTRP